VRSAGTHAHTPAEKRTRLEGRLSTARIAAWNACTRSSSGGGATAIARMGAAGRRPRSPSPATAYPRHEGRVTTAHHKPPRDGSPRDAPRRKGRSCTPGWRRDARSACCSTARRRVIPSPPCTLARSLLWRGHWVVAAWGGHGPDSRRHGATRRRPWGGGGAARPASSGSKARAQAG
jgi:hypothetical protein